MEARAQISHPHPHPRILLVEDSTDNREMYATYLSYEGFDVVQAANAEEALREIAREPPNLVVTDIALPGEDGLSLCRQVRERPEWNGTALMALTGLALSRADVEAALDAGPEIVLFKPCLPDRLLAEIRRLIGRSEHLRVRAREAQLRARKLTERSLELQERSARLHLRARRLLTGLGQEHLVERMQEAYRDMPALALTLDQGRRLWGTDHVSCEIAFDELVASGWLVRTADGAYVRPWSQPSRLRDSGDGSH